MKTMRFPTKFSLLALGLVLAILLSGCSSGEPTESPVVSFPMSPTPPAPLPTDLPSLDVQIPSLLSRNGWTIKERISTYTIKLPKTLQHRPGDFPYAIYWAYNNEFNKAIGLDLVPYLGQTVQASLYLLNEPLPEEFHPHTIAYAVIVTFDNKIIGAWIDRGRHYGFASSLDKKDFREIVGEDWSRWLVSSGVVDVNNDPDQELSKKSPEEIIKLYFAGLNEHDYHMSSAVRSRRNVTFDLFSNKNTQDLFNHQEDTTITEYANTIRSVELLSIEKINNPRNCLPVYQVYAHYEFVNPQLSSNPEGNYSQFVVLNEEIKGLGWRIEEINTAPGVSQRLCAP